MKRDTVLGQIENTREPWDFLVIGGGATGLGVAVDASARGYRTLLVEQYDFAKGTSSRSTKLVHGGVRYLKQGNISLVLEALRERGLRKCAASGSSPGVHRADLQLVGRAVLRHRDEDLRPPRG
jgi:glycerol-3-phosphate dehydrogenase